MPLLLARRGERSAIDYDNDAFGGIMIHACLTYYLRDIIGLTIQTSSVSLSVSWIGLGGFVDSRLLLLRLATLAFAFPLFYSLSVRRRRD